VALNASSIIGTWIIGTSIDRITEPLDVGEAVLNPFMSSSHRMEGQMRSACRRSPTCLPAPSSSGEAGGRVWSRFHRRANLGVISRPVRSHEALVSFRIGINDLLQAPAEISGGMADVIVIDVVAERARNRSRSSVPRDHPAEL
jgi:hypothetical protein